jgi:SH2 domain
MCTICRAETAALLQQHAVGTFLLRLNGKNTDSIVISFVTAAASASSTAAALQHVLVKVESEGRCSMTLSQHLQHSNSSSSSSSGSSSAAAYRKQDYPTLAELISECAALTALLPAAAVDISGVSAEQLQTPQPVDVATVIARLRSVR